MLEVNEYVENVLPFWKRVGVFSVLSFIIIVSSLSYFEKKVIFVSKVLGFQENLTCKLLSAKTYVYSTCIELFT